MTEMIDYRKTFIEIDNSILENNARILTREYPHKYYIAVVKGNAYGHGYGIIPALKKGGINAYAVSNLNEALKVREYERELPVIMLEPVHKEYYGICADNNISVCVNDSETFIDIVESGLDLKLHIKVDCGMNRLGFKEKSELERIYSEAVKNEKLTVEGIFTHFHTTGLSDTEYERDYNRFVELTAGIPLKDIPMVHVDKSQTVMAHEKPGFTTAVRFGVVLYGFNLMNKYSSDIKGRLRKLKHDMINKKNHVKPVKPYPELDLKTALTLYTEVIQVKKAKKGEYVGYGMLHLAEEDEIVATIDTGYGDGINRKRVGSSVAINGKKYPIIGEIGMGMCEIKVDDSVKKYDKVTVFGGDIPIRTITRHVMTTMYELMTNLDSSIPRIYKE
ncbi:MAG: alanine racemase [Lachnospiraceae bacterium]|nr:alanine racemase [Lachnospiraceae bacterium]